MDISSMMSIERSGINFRTIGQFLSFTEKSFSAVLVQIQNDFEIQGSNNEIENQTSWL
mgnify:CR=1 FL=1